MIVNFNKFFISEFLAFHFNTKIWDFNFRISGLFGILFLPKNIWFLILFLWTLLVPENVSKLGENPFGFLVEIVKNVSSWFLLSNNLNMQSVVESDALDPISIHWVIHIHCTNFAIFLCFLRYLFDLVPIVEILLICTVIKHQKPDVGSFLKLLEERSRIEMGNAWLWIICCPHEIVGTSYIC